MRSVTNPVIIVIELLAVWGLSGVQAWASQGTPLSRSAYLEVIREYSQGRLEGRDVEMDLERLRPDALRRWQRAMPLSGTELTAAVLLHTEVALLKVAPGRERSRDRHMDMAETLVRDVADESFRKRWRLSAGYLYQSTLSPSRALHHLGQAEEEFGAFGEQLLASGMVHEVLGTLALENIPEWTAPSINLRSTERRQFDESRSSGRKRLREAVNLYTRAISVEPTLIEARLRRGRCLQLLGELIEARADLDYVAESGPGYDAGLANFFRGQARAKAGDYNAAASLYSKATSNLPSWQLPYLALSHALERNGDRESSLSALETGLRLTNSPMSRRGGLWQYHFGLEPCLRIIDDLRRVTLQ